MLAVLADRQKETVVAFLCSMPEALRRTIERAGMDMDEGFVSAMEAAVPWAEIVIERCPGARAYRDGADTGRKQELQRRTRALPTVESAGHPRDHVAVSPAACGARAAGGGAA